MNIQRTTTFGAAMQRQQHAMTSGDAQQLGPKRFDPFSKLDADGDGQLSDTELKQMADKISQHTGQEVSVEELKAKLDADGSGSISAEELRQGMPPPPPPGGRGPGGPGELPPDAFDASGNLSSDVISAMASKLSEVSGTTVSASDVTAQLDVNGDGSIDKTEAAQAQQLLMQAHMRRM